MRTAAPWICVLIVCTAACGRDTAATGSGKPVASAEEIKRAIGARNAELRKVMLAGDVDGVLRFYHEDAILSRPIFAPAFRGTTGLRAFWGMNFADGLPTRTEFVTLEVIPASSGEMAQEIGHYIVGAPEGQGGYKEGRGIYVYLWVRRADGQWVIKSHAYNPYQLDPDEGAAPGMVTAPLGLPASEAIPSKTPPSAATPSSPPAATSPAAQSPKTP